MKIIRVDNTLNTLGRIQHVYYVFSLEMIKEDGGSITEVDTDWLDDREWKLAIKHILEDLQLVEKRPELFDTDAGPHSETLRREIAAFLDKEYFREEREVDENTACV